MDSMTRSGGYRTDRRRRLCGNSREGYGERTGAFLWMKSRVFWCRGGAGRMCSSILVTSYIMVFRRSSDVSSAVLYSTKEIER